MTLATEATVESLLAIVLEISGSHNFPALSAAQVKDILLRSSFRPDIMVNRPGATVKVPFSSLSVSGGIVNAYNAIATAIEMAEQK